MKNPVKQKQVKHCSKANLLERGWTAGSIARWLGEPDAYADNPHRGGADISLYSLRRVANAEAKSDWKTWREQMDKRRATHADSGAKAVATKLRIIQEYVDGIKITLPTLTKDELTRNACHHYNSLHFKDGKYADPSDSPVFLARIAKNYLRHSQCEYEMHLLEIAGRTGCEGAYQGIREKVDRAIETQYPFLI